VTRGWIVRIWHLSCSNLIIIASARTITGTPPYRLHELITVYRFRIIIVSHLGLEVKFDGSISCGTTHGGNDVTALSLCWSRT